MIHDGSTLVQPRVRRLWASVVVMALGLAWLDPAVAARNCRIRVLPTIFGVYLPGQSSPTDTAGSVQLRCVGRPRADQDTLITLKISGGSSGFPASRSMPSATTPLTYNLFKDAARTQIWGDGSKGTTGLVQRLPPNQKIVQLEIPVYGRIPAQQNPTPGSYEDTLIVTVEF